MGTTSKLLLLLVFGIILYVNLVSDFAIGIQVPYQLDSTRDDDDLPEETNLLNDVFNATLGVSNVKLL